MSKIVLGISAFYHDSAAVFVGDNGIICAAQEERFSRLKGDSRFPEKSIVELMKQNNIKPEDISAVGYYENSWKKAHRISITQLREAPFGWRQTLDVFQNHELKQYRIGSLLKKLNIFAPVQKFSHHQSHAASAFFPSQFSNAAILTVDGVGEWATATIGLGDKSEIKIVKEMRFPHSVGLLYASFTTFCGFKVNSGEYKLMGLAPYGSPKFADVIREKIVKIHQDGSIELDLKYFDFTRKLGMYSKEFEGVFGICGRKSDEYIEEIHCDIASSIQRVLEEIIKKCSIHALEITKQEKLTLAGGVALNCVANSTLDEVLPIENIFVQPAAGDAGGALGAAILAKKAQDKKYNKEFARSFFRMKHAFLGTFYSEEEINEVISRNGVMVSSFTHEYDRIKRIIDILESGGVVGYFQDRMEFGPRALGARSILADPRKLEMQKRLNLKIKQRESFRPFAPMVLDTKTHEWFDWPKGLEAPFMLFTAKVLSEHLRESDNKFPSSGSLTEWVARIRSTIPAVTHVDLSARIQTVNRHNPAFPIISAFYERTNVPILVNTSFNVRGEPIVESPQDALDCFLQTDMDALVIGESVIEKQFQSKETLEASMERKRAWDLD